MSGLNKRQAIPRIRKAREAVNAEIIRNAEGSRTAGGLSGEGFAGGYREALDDVLALLEHGYPSDHRGYFRRTA